MSETKRIKAKKAILYDPAKRHARYMAQREKLLEKQKKYDLLHAEERRRKAKERYAKKKAAAK